MGGTVILPQPADSPPPKNASFKGYSNEGATTQLLSNTKHHTTSRFTHPCNNICNCHQNYYQPEPPPKVLKFNGLDSKCDTIIPLLFLEWSPCSGRRGGPWMGSPEQMGLDSHKRQEDVGSFLLSVNRKFVQENDHSTCSLDSTVVDTTQSARRIVQS